MGRRRTELLSERTVTGIAEATAERVMLSGELLKSMAQAMATNEKVQRRFRNAVLIRLSKIETLVQLIHTTQIDEANPWGHPGWEERRDKQAEAADRFIEQRSDELGISMINYIYAEGKEAGAISKKRPKWAECPDYEI